MLADAGYDLGFEVLPAEKASSGKGYSDDDLVARAKGGFLVSPRIERAGASVRVRLIAVAPSSPVLLVRSEVMTPDLIEVRGVQMLRDLVQAAEHSSPSGPTEQRPGQESGLEALAPRSAGRAVLALNAAVLGGYVGFALQRASGSDDERLTYPLAALGAGIGLGASLLVAEEWDIGVGDAWYLSAGIWWPAAGSLLLAQSYDVDLEDRYIYGMIGAGAGLASATAALALGGNMTEGGATIAHSGGAFGLGLGGLGSSSCAARPTRPRPRLWLRLDRRRTRGRSAGHSSRSQHLTRAPGGSRREPRRARRRGARQPAPLGRGGSEPHAHSPLAVRRGRRHRGRRCAHLFPDAGHDDRQGRAALRSLRADHAGARQRHPRGARGLRQLVSSSSVPKRTVSIIVAAHQAGWRLDRVLLESEPELGRRRAKELFASGAATCARPASARRRPGESGR